MDNNIRRKIINWWTTKIKWTNGIWMMKVIVTKDDLNYEIGYRIMKRGTTWIITSEGRL